MPRKSARIRVTGEVIGTPNKELIFEIYRRLLSQSEDAPLEGGEHGNGRTHPQSRRTVSAGKGR